MTLDCSDEALVEALRAHEERLGKVLLEARPIIDQIKNVGAQIEDDVLQPLETLLDTVFSQMGLTSSDLLKLGNIDSGMTPAEIEQSLTNRGLAVSNGRVLVPGPIDLTVIALLARLLGSFDEVKRVLEPYRVKEAGPDPLIKPKFATNFLLVVTHNKHDFVPGDVCRAGYETVTETLLGVNKPIPQILLENKHLVRADLILYFFWLGRPEASQRLKDQAAEVGLKDDEFIDIVVGAEGEQIKCPVIPDPDVVFDLDDTFGGDCEDILKKIPAINPTPTVPEIISCIDDSGVTKQPPGRTNDIDVNDYFCPGPNLMAVLDPEKTFGSYFPAHCFGANYSLPTIDLFHAISAAGKLLDRLLLEASRAFSKVLNRLTNMIGLIDNFVLRLASCFFRGVNASVPLAIAKDLSAKLDVGLGLFDKYFSLVGQALNLAGPVACIRASLVGLVKTAESFMPGLSTSVSKIPGVSCVVQSFDFDFCLELSLNIGGITADFSLQLINSTFNQLRMCLNIVRSLVFGIMSGEYGGGGSNPNYGGCLTAESAILLVKLTKRALQTAGTGLPV